MKTLSINPDDLDALARLVYAEAGNQSQAGRLSVLYTILNRAAAGSDAGFADSIHSVIEQQGQFEPMLGLSSYKDLPEAPPFIANEVMAALSSIQSGDLSDPTGGATFFQNPRITRARGTNFADSPALTVIGDHAFYNRYGNNDPVAVPAFGVELADSGHNFASTSDAFGTSDNLSFVPSVDAPVVGAAAAINPVSLLANTLDPDQPITFLNRRPAGSAEAEPSSVPPSQDTYRANAVPTINPDGTYTYDLKGASDSVDLADASPLALDAARRAAAIFGKDLTINSGYRSQDKQDKLKAAAGANNPRVAKNSHHTAGDAFDISIAGMSDADVAALVDALVQSGFTGFGYYGKNSHLHADMRPTVPNSFGKNSSWGGWTTLPKPVFDLLRERGYKPGLPASEIYRGALT